MVCIIRRFGKLILLIGLVYFSTRSHASVEVFDQRIDLKTCSTLALRKNGDISPGDALRFVILYSQFVAAAGKDGCIIKSLTLNSDGGNVEEALELGRKIRQYEFQTAVIYKGRCLSACVFLLGAGVDRVNLGVVGIHRPYFYNISSELSTAEIKKRRDDVASKIRKYLVDIDVSERLLDDMLGIPPERMKILSDDELTQYRLDGRDATYDEKKTAQDAKEYGVSSAEYRRRSQLAEALCPKRNQVRVEGRLLGVQDYECKESVLLGISRAEYKVRAEKIRRICLARDDDLNRAQACIKHIRLNG